MKQRNIIGLSILTVTGCLTIVPVVITPVLFPLYLIGTVVIILILYKTNLLDKTLLSPSKLGVVYVSVPQILMIGYLIKNFLYGSLSKFMLIAVGIAEIVLIMGFFTVKFLSRHMLRKAGLNQPQN